MIELTLFLLSLTLKHFICDGWLQRPYQYLNKGIYMHPGGLIHAAIHGIGTGLCVLLVSDGSIIMAQALGAIDMVIHYHIDYIKTRIEQCYEWSGFVKDSINNVEYKAIYNNNYFIILILDQCLHFATYVGIMFLLFDKNIVI